MEEQGGGKGGRQNPKTKISTLTQQLKELEEELAAVEKDCAQLDEENKALLEQAQSREAEVERERAKIARAMPPPQQAPAAAAASPQGAPPAPEQQGGGSMPGGAQQGPGGAGDPALVITSCPGCTFTVTRTMLEGSPRLDLERIYSALLQHMQHTVSQYRETENHLKAALLSTPDLNPGAGAPPQQAAQLEAQLSMQSQNLRGPVADVLSLYAAAFRADAAQTDGMARRLVHAVSSAHGTAAADKALRLPEDLTRSLAQSIKRFLSIVTDCMERRKQLQANLRQPSDALLEWEAVAQWLRNDAVIGELQRVLAREADAYLEWAQYACTNVWPPVQAAQILLAYPPAELFQLACRVLAHAVPASTGATQSAGATAPMPGQAPGAIPGQQPPPHSNISASHAFM